MALTLYHVEWCPECDMVRRKLAELHVPYEGVVVPDFRPLRKEVFAVSGQYYVPVLQDGDTVLSDTHEILAHLDMNYGNTGARHEARGEGAEGQDEAPSCSL